MSLKRVLTVLMVLLACASLRAGTLQVVDSGTTQTLRCVNVLSENYAVISGGTALIKYDGTALSAFTPAPVWSGADFWGTAVVSQSDMWLGEYTTTSSNEFGHFDGTAWTIGFLPFDVAGGNYRVYNMWADNSGLVVMGTNTGVAVLDKGYVWTPNPNGVANRTYISTTAFADVDATSANNIWAVGDGNQVQLSTDRGATWTSKYTGTGVTNFKGVSVLSPTSVWICSNSTSPSKVYHWNGTSYDIHSIPGITYLNSIFAFSDTDVWICGAGGVVGHYNGVKWALLDTASIGVSEILNHIDGFGNTVLIVGNSGRVIKATYDANPWPVGCVPNTGMDFNRDCSVDFEDFSDFAEAWLSCANANDPACL